MKNHSKSAAVANGECTSGTSNNGKSNASTKPADGSFTGVVKLGPDLNQHRTPLDHKLYRQILLPNGMRCVLIQDTTALHQVGGDAGYYSDDDDDESSSSASSAAASSNDAPADEDNVRMSGRHRRLSGKLDDSDTDDDDDEDDDDDDDEPGIRDAAAAILVGAGSAYDPQSCQGLAHFLEHLLFMGSAKYPGENEYDNYVSKHGGSDNAWTEWEYTVYSLSIQQEYLWPALDRLAQFFVEPLLLESAVDRELKAIESEFQLNRMSDECRRGQLHCATSRPDHFMAKFSWGSVKSLLEIPAALNVDKMKELRTFFNQYYYAANMRLVVMGAYTLDQLQARVTDMFQHIPALPREPSPLYPLPVQPKDIASWDATYDSPLARHGPPFLPKSGNKDRNVANSCCCGGKIFRIVPVKDRHVLTITWPMPPLVAHWKSKPNDFLAHLLGHEAAGSVLSYGRTQNWATSCLAGVGEEGSEHASSHALFAITFVLSEQGLAEWRKLVNAVYQYIGMLRWLSLNNKETWADWIYQELKQIQDVSHRFADEESPEDTVEGLVEDMAPHLRMPPERLLDGSSLLFEFDSSLVDDLLNTYMTPANSRIDLMSSSYGSYNDDGGGAAAAKEEGVNGASLTKTTICNLRVEPEPDMFDPAGSPYQVEPMFGTHFWCHAIPDEWLEDWTRLAEPQRPSLPLDLPPRNPFVPTRYDLKPVPDTDAHHPLLNSSMKLCIPVGKKKNWFPATAIKYNRQKNSLLLSFEDEEEKWHRLDQDLVEFTPDKLTPAFEGTMDKKKIKFRVTALAQHGSGSAVRLFGDESDAHVLDGKTFPPIPPALPPSRQPKEISSSNTLRMWHLQDRRFHRPIAELRLEIICQAANSSPLHMACAELLTELIADSLMEISYLASVSELGSSLEATCVGFYMRIHGFDDKLLDLFERCMKVFLSFRGLQNTLPEGILTRRFEACLELLLRKYHNDGASASKLCSNSRLKALRQNLWFTCQKWEALHGVTVETFSATVSEILQSFAVESLYHGNVDESDAKKAKDLILSMIQGSQGGGKQGLPRKKYPSQTVLKVPVVKAPSLIVLPSKEATELNTAVELYVQVGKDNLRERCMLDLLVQILEEPVFDQIRTKDQYGYDVDTDIRWTFGIMGMIFKIVSNSKSAEDIVARIDRFLVEFRQELVEMSDEDFMGHLVGLATQKLDMFNSLSEEVCTAMP